MRRVFLIENLRSSLGVVLGSLRAGGWVDRELRTPVSLETLKMLGAPGRSPDLQGNFRKWNLLPKFYVCLIRVGKLNTAARSDASPLTIKYKRFSTGAIERNSNSDCRFDVQNATCYTRDRPGR